jgi:hypothetical protein
MAKLSKDLSAGALHPRETLFASGALALVNSEIALPVDGCATIIFDIRGTFNLEFIVEASVDNVNWQAIAIRPVNGFPSYALRVSGSTPGTWTGSIAGFRFARARCSGFTSGAGMCILSANGAPLDQSLVGMATTSVATTLGAAGAATTLTLNAPPTGLRHYLTYLSISRFASAALTASATPVTIPTSNLPGALAFTLAADALQLGQRDPWREDFAFPIAASGQGTATTIICPATPSVIWRVTAGFYVAP